MSDNSEYTVYFKKNQKLLRPCCVDRRGLKSFLENFADENAFHPDVVMLSIDVRKSWENTHMRIIKGRPVDYTETDSIITTIQERLANRGIVYVKYQGDPIGAAVLRLVRSSEFRYDRSWKFPEHSQYASAPDEWIQGTSDKNQDDGNLNPEVHVGIFDTESEALDWLLKQES